MELIEIKNKHHCVFLGPHSENNFFPENISSLSQLDSRNLKRSFILVHGNSEQIIHFVQEALSFEIPECFIVIAARSYSELKDFKKSFPFAESILIQNEEPKQEFKTRLLGKMDSCKQNALNWFLQTHKGSSSATMYRAFERVRLAHALCLELKLNNEDYLKVLNLAYTWEQETNTATNYLDGKKIVEIADAAIQSIDSNSFKQKLRAITSTLPFTEKSKFNSAVESTFSAFWRHSNNVA